MSAARTTLPSAPPGPPPRGRWRILPALSLAAALLGASPTPAREAIPERSDRVVRYEIDAWLDDAAHTIQGKERITWRNESQDVILELQLHLYMNAFKNERTTFMRESKGRHRSDTFKEGEWGYIDLLSLELEDGTNLLPSSSFIQPDDGNEDDETVLRVLLPKPVEPGGEVRLKSVFATRLPRVFARTGYRDEFYLAGQWFPKLGVYEKEGTRGREVGGWNCHQFHSRSEFYADYGSWDVRITVPSSFVVGATGSLEGEPERSAGGKTTTYHYVQDDVHDFAWTADPDFVEVRRTFKYAERRDPGEERRMARILGLDGSRIPPAGATDLSGVPEELRLGDVEVTLLIQPEHRAQIDRHFEAAFNAILYFGYWFGAYPYRTLTIVDPAYGGRGAGGMEYPTFITAGTRYLAPAWRESPEGVIVHEYGHQYWYGLVGTNEFEEAWLDEGVNTYGTGRLLEKVYGPDRREVRVAGVPLDIFPMIEIPSDGGSRGAASASDRPRPMLDRLLFMRWAGASNDSLLNFFRDLPVVTQPGDVPVRYFEDRRERYLEGGPTKDRILRNDWEFYDDASYGLNVYSKTGVMLDSLRTLLGADVFDRGLRLYADRFRFKHPGTDDFVATMSEAAGRDLSWYFDQTVRGSDLLDYGIATAESKPVPAAAGVFGPPGDRRILTKEEARQERKKALGADGKRQLETEVTARRFGEVRIPMDIVLDYEGGRSETVSWDGQYRWKRIRETGTDRLVKARIGPPGGLTLESDLTNDARATKADRWPAFRWWTRLVGWVQNVLYFYSGIS
ncbi:MAG TPA: M1 family metallopeptidase [Candidatus Saccharimonadales bacterium]|nr:M1 family metallopeptidase [Candidatus Saccharimonadales bacterium]